MQQSTDTTQATDVHYKHLSEVMQSKNVYIFDITKTVLNPDGSSIPYANLALRMLTKEGKHVLFWTNNTQRSRSDMAAVLTREFGTAVIAEEIVTPVDAMLATIKKKALSRKPRNVWIGCGDMEDRLATDPDMMDISKQEDWNSTPPDFACVGYSPRSGEKDTALIAKAVKSGATLLYSALNETPIGKTYSTYAEDMTHLLEHIASAAGCSVEELHAEATGKPKPDGILHLLQTLGCTPKDALKIGDADVDVEAGVNLAHAVKGAQPADYVVHIQNDSAQTPDVVREYGITSLHSMHAFYQLLLTIFP